MEIKYEYFKTDNMYLSLNKLNEFIKDNNIQREDIIKINVDDSNTLKSIITILYWG